MPAIFISHSSVDRTVSDEVKAALARLGFERVFLDFDKTTGIGVGDNWEKRLYEEISRCHAVLLLLTPAWLASKWCFVELAQARALGKVILPVLCAPLGQQVVLPEVQAVDLVDWNADGLTRLEQRLRAISNELARGFTLAPNRPPYPGINAFEAEDAAIYFGRDEEARGTIERLDARRTQGGARFVIIIGASGSGKSSLLKASVLPQLGQRRAQWVLLPCIRPEKAPLEAMAKAIAQHLGKPEAWREWHERLSGPDAVAAIERLVQDARIGDARAATVLLPIDQFEEVFTTTGAAERAGFLTLLATMFDRDIPFMVVATGRSDVLEGLVESSELVHRYEPYPLAAVPLERVPRLVEGPAAVAGLNIEKGLPERIVRDVENTEALPLLAHMLSLLYRRGGDDKKLALSEYDALGDPARGLNPIQNSVRLAADEAIARLKPSEQELAALRDAFVPHLVRVRLDDGKRVRQPARRSELPPEALRLIGALVEARLLMTRGAQDGGPGGDPIIEVTHESLFKAWPTLDGWLTDEQAFLIDLERIRSAHENWEGAPAEQKSGELLYGLLLSRARDWLLKYPQRFLGRDMEPLRTYIAASAEVADAERARAQRSRRRILQGAVAAALILFAATVFAGVQWYSADRAQREAIKERKIAEEQRNQALITQSRFLMDLARDNSDRGANGVALALALEALPDERRGIVRPYVPAAESLLYQLLSQLREQRTFQRGRDDFHGAKFMPGGQRVIMFSHRRNIPRIRDVATGGEVFALEGHSQGLTTVAFSPNGQEILTASYDGTARTWGAADGRRLREFKGHSGTVQSAAFSRDGRRIVTASLDGTARIWNAADDAAPPQVLPMPGEIVNTVAFSPGGERIATVSSQGTQRNIARLWDAASGEILKELDTESKDAWTHGRHAVTVAKNGLEARIWDVASGSQVGDVPGIAAQAHVVFSPDGRRIAVMSSNKLAVWEAATPPRFFEWELPESVSWPVFSADGQKLAAFRDKTTKVWDIDTAAKRAILTSFDLAEVPETIVDLSPDGRRIITVFHDSVRIWDATDSGPIRQLHGARAVGRESRGLVLAAAFSPDGRRIVTASGGNTAMLWDTASGALLASKEHPDRVRIAAFLPDGTHVATVSHDGTVRIWDIIADAAPVVIGGHQWIVESLSVSSDGKRLVTTSATDEYARIWDAGSSAPPIVSGPYPKPASGVSFSPDGRQVIAVSNERAWLWNGTSNGKPAQLGAGTGIQAAAFSVDGGKIRILSAETHKELMIWQAHERRIATAVFSPDGRRILTAADDNTARLWDAASGVEVAVLRGHEGHVSSAAFSPDGWIVTTSKDRSVRLWPAFETTQALVDHARAIMPRQLTPEQRKQFFLDPEPASTAATPLQ